MGGYLSISISLISLILHIINKEINFIFTVARVSYAYGIIYIIVTAYIST